MNNIELRSRRRDARDLAGYLPCLILLPGILIALFIFLDQLNDNASSGRKVKMRNNLADSSSIQAKPAAVPDPFSEEKKVDGYADDGTNPLHHVHKTPSKGGLYHGTLSKPQLTKPANAAATDVDANDDKDPWTCQIVYIVGVEGSGHHGVSDLVVQNFARRQVDSSGRNYTVKFRDDEFHQIMWSTSATPKSAGEKVAPEEIQNRMSKLCGPKYGGNKRTVIIEDISFPTGFDVRKAFEGRPALDIEFLLNLSPTPVDLRKFFEVFSPHADIKYIVLHRPYTNVVVSRSESKLDGGIVEHGVVISGHLRYLGKLFLETNFPAKWKLLCVDQLRNDANVEKDDKGLTRRGRLLGELAEFLGWGQANCEQCFKRWYDSTNDPESIAGQATIVELEKQRDELRGIWPPGGGGGEDCPL